MASIATLATGVLLLTARGASAREWRADRELLSMSQLSCGEEAGESCCPTEYGSCAPGLVCMSDRVCEPCGESRPCDEVAASLWTISRSSELPLGLAGLEAQSGSYGDDLGVYGDEGGIYGEDSLGLYGSDDPEELTGGPDEGGRIVDTLTPEGRSVTPSTAGTTPTTDRSTALPTVQSNSAPADVTTPESAGTSSSSSSVPVVAAAVAGCAAVIAGVSVLVYTKRAALIRSPTPAAAV